MSTPAHRPRYSYREYLLLEMAGGTPEHAAVAVNVSTLLTAEYDRVEKVGHYRQIPSLRDIVLVDHPERLIEVWSRGDDGDWTRREARSGQAASLASVGVTLDVDEVYRDPLSDSSGGA